MDNKFNLVDEPWIPVAGKGKVSLKTIFSDETITSLGGNPVEKIAVFKLLLAIAQSAYTPKDDDDWEDLGCNGMKQKVLDYLEKHHDCFWLYGEKPFLQMKEIEKAKIKSFGNVQMEVVTGNTTIVTEIQSEKILDDSEKAMIVLLLMGFSFGGKKVDNSVVLSSEYTGKRKPNGDVVVNAKPGSSLDSFGVLHSFFMTETILQSVYINLFSAEQIEEMAMFKGGLGKAPWEQMPTGEDDAIAKVLKKSYIGRLVPINRFVLLRDDGIHYSEGLIYPNYADLVVDPSVTVDIHKESKPIVLWTDPEKKPWRQITSLLSFLNAEKVNNLNCFQLSVIRNHLQTIKKFYVWSGGIKLRIKAGEQYLSGTDDFVESEVQLSSTIFGSNFYSNLSLEMEKLEKIANSLYGSIKRYYADVLCDGKQLAAQGTNLFWQLCEGEFQNIINACSSDNAEEKLVPLRKKIFAFACQIYDQQCPNQTARQLEAWAKNKLRNNHSKKEE